MKKRSRISFDRFYFPLSAVLFWLPFLPSSDEHMPLQRISATFFVSSLKLVRYEESQTCETVQATSNIVSPRSRNHLSYFTLRLTEALQRPRRCKVMEKLHCRLTKRAKRVLSSSPFTSPSQIPLKHSQ